MDCLAVPISTRSKPDRAQAAATLASAHYLHIQRSRRLEARGEERRDAGAPHQGDEIVHQSTRISAAERIVTEEPRSSSRNQLGRRFVPK